VNFIAPNQARTMTRPYRATRAAIPVARYLPRAALVTAAASSCDMQSPFSVFRSTDGRRERSLPPLAPQPVQAVVQALGVASQINDHYRCAGGELSSSGRVIHPGERTTRLRIAAAHSPMTRSQGGRGEQTSAMLNDGAVSAVSRGLIVYHSHRSACSRGDTSSCVVAVDAAPSTPRFSAEPSVLVTSQRV
jgi:hypothetical protein